MKLINDKQYKCIFKNNIVYDDLENAGEDFYEYNNSAYYGVAFGDSEISGRLNKLYVYNNGLKSGICREWHSNGTIKEETLEHISQYGYKRKWNEDGKMIYESLVLGYCLIYEKIIQNNGEFKEEIYYDNIIRFKNIVNNGRMYKDLKDIFYDEDISKNLIEYINEPTDIYKRRKKERPIPEKRFIDTRYYKKVFKIFKGICNEDTNNFLNDKLIEEIRDLLLHEEKHRYSVYDKTVNVEEVEIKDELIFNNGELYTGLITKFIDDELLNCNMLRSLTECKKGMKDGLELIWDFEGRLNPDGIETYGSHYEGYRWWSKELLKEIRYYKEGKLIEKQQWDNSNLK